MPTGSFTFLFFVALVLLLYYFFPKRYRWLVLLVGSVIFFLNASGIKLLPVFLGICLVNYLAAIGIGSIRKNALSSEWKAKAFYCAAACFV